MGSDLSPSVELEDVAFQKCNETKLFFGIKISLAFISVNSLFRSKWKTNNYGVLGPRGVKVKQKSDFRVHFAEFQALDRKSLRGNSPVFAPSVAYLDFC